MLMQEINITKPKREIRKKVDGKKSSLQFLPEMLEELSKLKKIKYSDENLKIPYLIDMVHSLLLKYYFNKENIYNLSSIVLKDKYGSKYNYYINYLIKNKILFMVSDYCVNKKARTYMLNEKIVIGEIKRYNNLDKILIKKYIKNVSQIENYDFENNSIEKEIKQKLVEDLFAVKIDYAKSIFYLDNTTQDKDIYNKNKYSVECVNDKHIFYNFDSYGRFHSNFTILKSFIRKNCLTIDGEETCEIDIQNSQPLFLTKLIKETNTKWVNSDEYDLFKYLTINGKYYQYIMDNLNIKNKGDAKELTYKVLFGRNASNSNSDKQFKKLFPTIHNFIKLYKKECENYRVLAHDLQKSESNLIYNNIIKKIMCIYPDVKLITVHDSIICQKSKKDEISAIFNRSLKEEFDL